METYYSRASNGKMITAKEYYKDGNLKRDDTYLYQKVHNDHAYELLSGLCLSAEGDSLTHTPYFRHFSFPGGNDALKDYLRKEVKYPAESRIDKVEGRVYVRFTIDGQTGNIKNVWVESSVDKYIDKEAMRVVQNMPQWTPAIEYGKPVDASYRLPINFILNNFK